MTKEELKTEVQSLYKKREILDTKIKLINAKLKKIRADEEEATLSTPKSPKEEMEYFLFEDGQVSGERYKAREKYWNDKGLWRNGYFYETSQICLGVMLYKGEKDNLEQTLQVLEDVIPLLKPFDDGVKRLSIFEHTLSEYGSWSIEITDESFDLILHRYRRKTVEKSFDNLRSLLEYVQENHYYKSSLDVQD